MVVDGGTLVAEYMAGGDERERAARRERISKTLYLDLL